MGLNILIRNLRYDSFNNMIPYQVKVDRSSVLGNPFVMKGEINRDKVCDEYETYFDANQNLKFKKELNRLVEIYKEHGTLELFCWCAPKRCHAETIAKKIKELVGNSTRAEK